MKTLFASAALALSLMLPAQAGDYALGDIRIEHPWARATAPGAANGAAYFRMSKSDAGADKLLSAAGGVAERVELHTHMMDNGVMKMRPVQAIEVEQGSATVLAPGGLHVMLIGLKKPLVAGEKFPLTLNFEKAGKVEVQVDVEAPDAAASKPMDHMTHGKP